MSSFTIEMTLDTLAKHTGEYVTAHATFSVLMLEQSTHAPGSQATIMVVVSHFLLFHSSLFSLVHLFTY